MAIILGIDAAWTGRGSSAVALLGTSGSERHVIGVAPCYAGFIGLADARQVEWIKPPGGAPDVAQLLYQRKEAIARREAGETLRDLPGPMLLVAFNMTS